MTVSRVTCRFPDIRVKRLEALMRLAISSSTAKFVATRPRACVSHTEKNRAVAGNYTQFLLSFFGAVDSPRKKYRVYRTRRQQGETFIISSDTQDRHISVSIIVDICA